MTNVRNPAASRLLSNALRLGALSLGALSLGALGGCIPVGSGSPDATTASTSERTTPSTAETTAATTTTDASPTTVDSLAGDDTASTSATSTVGTTSGPFEADEIVWEPCPGSDLECGTITVPVDYSDLSLGTLDLAVAIRRAAEPSERIGVLLINPGGPGASGVEFAEWATEKPFGVFGDAILNRFDIVGWDPRGVGDSEPEFGCGTDDDWIASRLSIDDEVDTPAEEETAREAVATCEDTMGPAAWRLGSYFVAQDMDQIRIALGEEKISYFGASYGSAIGVWYATLFPDRVRAMVVDGADNPVDDQSTDAAIIQSAREEYEGLEEKLGEALEACNNEDCPIYNDGDPVGFYLDHVDDLNLVNDEFGGNPDAGFLAVITPLYDENEWPLLWAGLAAVADGDPGPLKRLADRQMMGEEGANDTAHINCLDSWSLGQAADPKEDVRISKLVEKALRPDMPLLFAFDDVTSFCTFFGEHTPPPLDEPLNGGDVPIVVIGNTSDPVTPYTESEELVDQQLDNGYLVVADYPAHVVYPNNPCVVKIVEQVLVDDSLPDERRTECGDAKSERPAASNADLLGAFCDQLMPDTASEKVAKDTCRDAVKKGEAKFEGRDLSAEIEDTDASVWADLGTFFADVFSDHGLVPDFSQ